MNQHGQIPEEKLILFLYDELSESEKAEVLLLLEKNPDDRRRLEELQKLHQIIPTADPVDISEDTLALLRREISHKIRDKKPVGRSIFSIFDYLLQPHPAFQIAMAAILFIGGFFLGRLPGGSNTSPTDDNPMQSMLTANREIQASNSAINPLLAGIERLQYDPASGKIEIQYTTINDISLQGGLENEAVQQLLKAAILEKNNPAVRLHAVKAVNAVVGQQAQQKNSSGSYSRGISDGIINALVQLLDEEENLGVKLKIVRVLKSFLDIPTVKAALIKLLLNKNLPDPLRIEALQTLLENNPSSDDLELLNRISREDSNEFFRSQGNRSIQANEIAPLPGSRPIEENDKE